MAGVDAALLFNILHGEEPRVMLKKAVDAVHPGGHVLVMHWLYGDTPRGPDLRIRPRPEQIVQWAREVGGLAWEGDVVQLPPWHYGLRLRVVGSDSAQAVEYARKRNPN